ncbi:hypothetical protein scyTo_0011936 [Scyliorhinus torazame]|uniref:Transmembrane protein 179B n=1 Tax=Scyliorhinus torazame TaxID=75743 RepID=A0A401NYN2_SCYTO|nr:hypothetical protein [Scyliorhinus torazame]
MGLGNRLLFCQCTAYLLAFVLSLFAAVPLGEDQHQLRGRCLLYGAGRWQQANGSGCAQAHCFHLLRWGPQAACCYSLFVAIFSCAYSALQGFRSTYLLCKSFQESLFSEFVSMLLSCTIALLMLVASATVSDGLNTWCNSVTNKGNTTISCRDAQEEPLNLNEVPTLFYDHFGTAQFGLWCAWIVWIVLAILAFLKISHSRCKDDFSVQYKETLLSQQSHGYFQRQVGSVFI